MKKQELLDLSSSMPDLDKSRVTLPIILLRRTDLGTGTFAILGDAYEQYVVSYLSGAYSGTFEDFRRRGIDIISIYTPQVASLIRKFHSLIALGFGTAGAKVSDPRV